MKVMQVMPEFGMAGAEIMCENLIYGLRKKHIDVFAVSLYDYHSPITDRLEKMGVKIYYIGKKTGFDFSVYKRLITIIKKEKPDVVHTHRYVMEYVIPIAVLCRIKIRVHTVHSVASKEQEKGKRILASFFYRFNHVKPVALSNEIKKTIIEEYGLKNESIPVVFNGEDLSHFTCKNDFELHTPAQIYHIGRFLPVKNHNLIIETAKRLKANGKNVIFHLVGDCSSEIGIQLQKKVEDEGLQDVVKFDGVKSNIPELLQDADIFILPSEYEGVPMTLIEAMATGLPIIATNVGGIPDMLNRNESAILIDRPDELYEAINKLLVDTSLRKKIGKNANKRSALFSNDEMATKYIEVYEE